MHQMMLKKHWQTVSNKKMTSTPHTLPDLSLVRTHMRPIKIPQDFTPVADLIEICFSTTLDEDGRRFIRQMRRAGQNPKDLQSFNRLSPSIKGYVWVEEGQIVGNLNLIPVVIRSRRSYLVVNVAVHPDHRRNGIANALTAAGLETASAAGAGEAWLQVDENNLTAQTLYENFGFDVRAVRTVWHSMDDFTISPTPLDIQVTHRRRSDWNKQKRWLNRLYNQDVRWNLPLNIAILAPQFIMGLLRFFSEYNYQQWSAIKDGEWLGSVTWQSSHSQADRLWLAAPPENRAAAITALLPFAVQSLRRERKTAPGRTLSVNFPAGDSEEAFKAAGFKPHQTLIWMSKSLRE